MNNIFNISFDGVNQSTTEIEIFHKRIFYYYNVIVN